MFLLNNEQLVKICSFFRRMIPWGNEDNIVIQNRFKLFFVFLKTLKYGMQIQKFSTYGEGAQPPPQTPPHADSCQLTVMTNSYFTPCINMLEHKFHFNSRAFYAMTYHLIAINQSILLRQDKCMQYNYMQ